MKTRQMTKGEAKNFNHAIWLVVYQDNKISVSTASFDQYTAQQLCHKYAKVSGRKHAVVKEQWENLPFELRVILRKSTRVEKEINQIINN